MVLKFIGAEPINWVIERVDGRTCPKSAVGPHRGARNKAALVHAKVLSDHRIGPDLGVAVQINRPKKGGLDYSGPRVQLDDAATDEGCIGGVVFVSVNLKWLVVHALSYGDRQDHARRVWVESVSLGQAAEKVSQR